MTGQKRYAHMQMADVPQAIKKRMVVWHTRSLG